MCSSGDLSDVSPSSFDTMQQPSTSTCLVGDCHSPNTSIITPLSSLGSLDYVCMSQVMTLFFACLLGIGELVVGCWEWSEVELPRNAMYLTQEMPFFPGKGDEVKAVREKLQFFIASEIPCRASQYVDSKVK